jgi:hypothetical protein
VNSHDATVAGYLILLAVGVTIQIASRRRAVPAPPLGAVVRQAMRGRPGRIALIAGWAWLGLHFFAR